MSKMRLMLQASTALLIAAAAGPAPGAPGSTASTGPEGASSHDLEVILRRGGCMLCHRWSRPWIGPPFAEISQRYRDMGPQGRQALAARLRNGSVGNHSPIPMGPCDVTRVNDDELRLIVDYVLGQAPQHP